MKICWVEAPMNFDKRLVSGGGDGVLSIAGARWSGTSAC